MHILSDLLSIKDAAAFRKVSQDTLRRWESRGLLTVHFTKGGHRRYKVGDLLLTTNEKVVLITLIYGYVEIPQEEDYLAQQIKILKLYCQDRCYQYVEVLQDIGISLCQEQGLFRLISLLQHGEVERLIITDISRIPAMGKKIVPMLCAAAGVELIILNKLIAADSEVTKDKTITITDDILRFISIIFARMDGEQFQENIDTVRAIQDFAEKIISLQKTRNYIDTQAELPKASLTVIEQ
jgi:putative resolvase